GGCASTAAPAVQGAGLLPKNAALSGSSAACSSARPVAEVHPGQEWQMNRCTRGGGAGASPFKRLQEQASATSCGAPPAFPSRTSSPGQHENPAALDFGFGSCTTR
ncbi:unnamed protein product, partial [Amoebophrya sp. A120]